jgi:hypothetical protein
MMIGLLIAGIVAIVAGVLAIAYGFMLELSFGNTLIMAGAFGLCSGIIVLAQILVVHELRSLGRKLSQRMAGEAPARPGTAEEGFSVPRDVGMETEAPPLPGPSAPPWRDDANPRDRMRQEPAVAPPPEMAEPTPPPSRRRNLMFSSNVRKDRERPPLAAEPDLPDEAADAPQASFEDTSFENASFDNSWPRADRPSERPAERPLRPSEMMAQRRAARAALAEGKAGAAAPERAVPPPPIAREEPPPIPGVTVIKSGVVDGMAYSLYSDGSIEAQMPEGLMRFASIDELRAHLDQRA